MKRSRLNSSLVTVISLLLAVLWLTPAFAAAPSFAPLGTLKANTLRIPGAMDLDAAGNLYVADTRGGLVHKFSPYGNLVQDLDLQVNGRGLAVTDDGLRLYVSRAQSVAIIDPLSGAELGVLSGAETDAPEFGLAGEIDLDANGNVYVVDGSSLQIKIYNASGQFLSRFGGVGTTAGQFMQVAAIAINQAGQVVVADSSYKVGKVQVFTLDSNLAVTGPVAAYANGSAANFGSPAMTVPRGLVFDNLGRGYLLDYVKSLIRVFDANFVYLNAYNDPGYGVGQVSNVQKVAFDQATNRLFVGCDNGRIEIFGIDGGTTPEDNNHAPSTPVPQSPVAGSEVSSATPTLVINNATDEDGDPLTYHVVVRRLDEVIFEAADVQEGESGTTSVPVDVVLEENRAYSWTVQVTDGEDPSDVSAAAAFVVNAVEEAPSIPTLVAPANGESVDGFVALSWQESVDVDPNDVNVSYQLEVALDEAFTQMVAVERLADTQLSLDALADYGGLEIDATYSWRVIALDDDQNASAPSPARQFIYDTTTLTVNANMPDAVVSFHGNHAYAGKTVGSAPLQLRDMTPATFSVVVERAGFEPYVAQVSLEEGDNLSLYAELVPAMEVVELDVVRKGINGRSGLSVDGAAAPFLVDFDNDGDLDLLVGDGSGQLTLFANLQVADRNQLYLDQGVALELPTMPGAVPFVADWNNDGRKDLIVGQANGFVTLFLNAGSEQAPAFAAGTDLYAGSSALHVGSNAAPAVLDYNGDGAKDLMVGNAAGQLAVYLNQGSDAAPSLAATAQILAVQGVGALPVDWNADGETDLLVAVNGDLQLYSNLDGQYRNTIQISEKKFSFAGATAFGPDSLGKALLAGTTDGELLYLSTGNIKKPKAVAAFYLALQDKVDELAELVAEYDPQLLSDVAIIRDQITAGDLDSARVSSENLAAELVEGPAKGSALELGALCIL